MKYLVLILVIALVIWAIRKKSRPSPPAGAKPVPASSSPAEAPVQMLACAHCGLHLPQTDSLPDADGRAYCSPAHRLAGPG